MCRVNQFRGFEVAYLDRRVDNDRGTNITTSIGVLLASESSN